MNESVRIAPSMLSADFLHLEKDVEFVNENADIFHLDIMDGTFVPNISFGFPVVEAIAKKAAKPMDAHLMIVHPEKYIERFGKAGVSMLSVHLETLDEPEAVLEQIRANGMKAGLVINPDVPVERLFPYLKICDFVLLMSVFAGFGGQKFIEASYERIRAVKAELTRIAHNIPIEVDGGVGVDNAAKVVAAGADILVAGSAVFNAEDRRKVIAAFRAV